MSDAADELLHKCAHPRMQPLLGGSLTVQRRATLPQALVATRRFGCVARLRHPDRWRAG